MIALITFTAMNVVTWIRSAPSTELRDASALDLAILGAALTGGAIGFLWYNAFPAEVFMGDTGSMAIGGAIGAFAVMTKTELLLLLIGGIFVIEALSVILQVFSFRYWGRRLFLMAPIHHHFEMKAWSETKIMVRFWILGRDPVRGGLRALLPLLPRFPAFVDRRRTLQQLLQSAEWRFRNVCSFSGSLAPGRRPRSRCAGAGSRWSASTPRRSSTWAGLARPVSNSISGPRRSECSTPSRL